MQFKPYHEIAPHLVFMAYLHRVVNGGGTIDREYATGTGRMDLCIRHRDLTLAIELKVWRDKKPDPLAVGLVQLETYLDGLGLTTGWLIIFVRRPNQPAVAARTENSEAITPGGKTITLIRA